MVGRNGGVGEGRPGGDAGVTGKASKGTGEGEGGVKSDQPQATIAVLRAPFCELTLCSEGGLGSGKMGLISDACQLEGRACKLERRATTGESRFNNNRRVPRTVELQEEQAIPVAFLWAAKVGRRRRRLGQGPTNTTQPFLSRPINNYVAPMTKPGSSKDQVNKTRPI